MNKIIVPTDFSSTAAAALRYGHFLAQATGLELEVIHVHDGYGHSESPDVKKGSMEARQTAQRRIDEFIRFNVLTPVGEGPAEPEATIGSKEITGAPSDVLIAASRDKTTSLIVMGGVGSGVVSTVTPFFGSVAKTVAKGAECPVLLVPKDYKEPSLKRASIAFDEANGLRETSKGFDFLRIPLKPAMRFVHVRDMSEKTEARKEIGLMEKILNTGFPGYPVELDLLDPGVTALQLLEYTNEQGVDLLVMGHRKRSFFKRLFTHSQTAQVVDYTGVPLLVIPIQDYA
ncbi:universal stress protein [Neolewinella aurantiaca]|uniref:Universal stress protein n=1 Tax=Neolewinella aurantiaca TaxID=2602767 RepID=A0A5C7F644_9BACT|nr:universal stress protein [Neolewinella aurantiaca]TXF84372.1 universal stress protein [Neolewinella aurantiaca]